MHLAHLLDLRPVFRILIVVIIIAAACVESDLSANPTQLFDTLEVQRKKEIERFQIYALQQQAMVEHPALSIRDAQLENARKNIERHAWAAEWTRNTRALADYYLDAGEAAIAEMIPALTPWSPYGIFCPACGADNTYTLIWNYQKPDQVQCAHCKQIYPDENFPEDGILECPRSGQRFSFYIRPAEKLNDTFQRGDSAYVWAGRKIHPSFTGVIRHRKIQHSVFVARAAALTFALTNEIPYARLAAKILVRLADVYPQYLVHDYWGTYLDAYPIFGCDLLAADTLLARYEVNACPEQSGRSGLKSASLIQTFWGCGRMSCGGVQAEAQNMILLAEAADLIWNAEAIGELVLSDENKAHLITNLFVEGLWTFTKWEGVNNKIATCRAGEIGLGRFLGLPEFLHKGFSQFETFLHGYFEADGASAEGPSYYRYALSNLQQLPELVLGYSDPPSYAGKDRYVDLNPYQSNSFYATVLRAGIFMQLPDGNVPTVADAIYAKPFEHHPAWLFEIAAARFGDEYLRHVDTRTGDEFALFNRRPDIDERDRLAVPADDRFFPAWRVAMLNCGAESRQTSLVMSFYEPKGHSHLDALNITLYAGSQELLSDLGYIGDNALDQTLRSTHKHNTVIIDGKSQLYRRSPGKVIALHATDWFDCIEASQPAYSQTEQYQRCCYLVDDAGTGFPFLIDIFRVKGGELHDYAFHAQGSVQSISSREKPLSFAPMEGKIGIDIESLAVSRPGDAPCQVQWQCGEVHLLTTLLSPVDELIKGEGHAQRTQVDIGKRLAFLFARKKNPQKGSIFAAVHEPFRQQPRIVEPKFIHGNDAEDYLALDLPLKDAETVHVFHNPGEMRFQNRTYTTDARHVIYHSMADGSFKLFFARGTSFEAADIRVAVDTAEITGDIAGYDDKGFTIKQPSIFHPQAWQRQFIKVIDSSHNLPPTAYQIADAKEDQLEVAHFPFLGGTSFVIDTQVDVRKIAANEFIVRSNAPCTLWIRTQCKTVNAYSHGMRLSEVKYSAREGGVLVNLKIAAITGKTVMLLFE
ncbi:heparinase II/III family protein [candidate division KSB1 bacterium]|nr:heparinase II/III family protein [candidate division KSB1 bacterium]